MSNSRGPHRHTQTGCTNTSHELGKRLRAGGWNGQSELVDCHPVGHSKPVNATVGDLSCEQLPQQYSIAGKQSCY